MPPSRAQAYAARLCLLRKCVVDSLAKTIIEIIRAGRPGDEHGQARIRGRTNQQLFLPDLLLIGADDDDDEQVPQLRVPDSKAHEQCLAPQYSGHDA